jgi:selenocysteine lyase/cysteine desulfurase
MFGPSTSQNTYVLAQAFRRHLATGDAIVVTNQDHEANSGFWRRLADDGIEIREWAMDEAGHLDLAALARLLDGRVRLVAFPHASNVVGEVNDVAAITALAHEAGAVVCVDGVSYAPHGLPDVGALGADIYLFSTYKTYGPHQGAMVVRRPLGAALPNQGHFFNDGVPAKRLTPAGPDHAQVAACAGIADYVEALHARHFNDVPAARVRAARVHDLQRAHETALLPPLLAFLDAQGLRYLGPKEPGRRVPTVAIDLGRAAEPVAAALSGHGIMAGGGDFYAVRPLRALGVDPALGVLRLSFVHYTTRDEIDRVTAALAAVL